MDAASLVSRLVSIGIAPKAAETTATNPELSATLLAMYDTVRPKGAQSGEDASKLAALLLALATTWPREGSAGSREEVLKRVGSREIDTAARLKEALVVSKEAGPNATVDWETLRTRCGVGVEQGPAEVAAALNKFLAEHDAAIRAGRYPVATKLRTDFSKLVKWADGQEVTRQWDEGLLRVLGPKNSPENTAATKAVNDSKKPAAVAAAAADSKNNSNNNNNNKKGPDASSHASSSAASASSDSEQSLGLVAGMDRFGSPADNKQIDPKLLAEHLAATGGRVVTRFPPEPNGYLHLGHALSMARVFGYAEAKGGYCILRYDDTNPEAEKQEYIDSIANDVKWMGYKPAMVTYASDNFQKLYDFAEQLIKKNLAYVCDLPMEAMREGRRLKQDSPFRNRSVEENLTLFRKMRDGYFSEGACTLRVRGDMQHDNPNMRDFVAYRIKYMPHPHAGDTWCIYPSYDYTHAICDSLENITHSICTLEFVSRNLTYQWLLDALHIYKPPQLEAQRLSMTHILLSKRKLLQLVNGGYVNGWTDARMPTLMGARRKGYAPRALHEMMLGMGISRSADGMIPIERLEEAMRSYYNTRAPRAMAVRRPLAVVVDNWPEGKIETLDVPDFPDDVSRGTHKRTFGKHLFIERSDWRDEDSAKYFGLAPGKCVRLKYAYIIKHVSTERDASGKATVLHVEFEADKTAKVKGTLSWLSKDEAVQAELRMLKHLFKSETPGLEKQADGSFVKKDFLLDLTPNSLKPIPDALIERRCHGAPVETVFQFERVGYFVVDPDSRPGKTVFNRTVSTKSTKINF